VLDAQAAANREFHVSGAHVYDRRGPVRWIVSHILRYPGYAVAYVGLRLVSTVLSGLLPLLVGRAFGVISGDGANRVGRLETLALVILGVVLARGVFDLAGGFSAEVLGKRTERDGRDELYLTLLGKSQTFHNRQRVGDIMARANNDMRQVNFLIVPGVDLIFESMLALVIPLIFIATLDPQLLLSPVIWVILFGVTLRRYTRRLGPVTGQLRSEFGALNATLNETVSGIEVVKTSAQEEQEARKFKARATSYRNLFVKQGEIQAFYLPELLLAIATVGAFLHGLWLVSRGTLSVGDLVAYMGLMRVFFFPSHISVFSFAIVQLGLAGARRILGIMAEESEVDQNAGGHAGQMRGAIEFQNVSFGYGDGSAPLLRNVSFCAEPGQTIAIVGQTGSGKTTLTKLVNRIYDATEGRVLVDDVDVRDWDLASLREQISTIEQDVFLFSRTIAENIGFSLGQQADRAAVERAAHDAQAHEFIANLPHGYDTEIGERGVTLSGGQRQRLAIARALLTDPRVLVLDDSTSAIDSATEDEIQQAIRRVLAGRTTLLITHRLSQIRWADQILVLHRGELVDRGTHAELLERCALYQRIFGVHEDAPVAAD
jgi:ATP-binding cassette subfamily B protein